MGKRSVYVKEKKIQPPSSSRVQLSKQNRGVSCAQIAHELGIAPNLLTRWRREADSAGHKAFSGTGSPRDEEVARLKRELARVKKERDFLREAATFFARESS